MELIPQEIKNKIPKLYETEEQNDPIAYVKLFIPDANWSWFITEISIDKDICFGLVISPFLTNGEMGYFSLNELKSIRGKLGLPIERDLWFKPTKLSDAKRIYCEN
jgi:hypothetical protein